jgi:low affinity Fe/Cu permease
MNPRLYASSPFYRFAKWTARAAGHPAAFGAALLLILGWIATGPAFAYSDTWQLVVNTATTIVTFLMVFLIQNTQNRDAEAMQLKLDELIRATQGAHNVFLDLEELTEHELDRIKARYCELARAAREDALAGRGDVGTPEVGSE